MPGQGGRVLKLRGEALPGVPRGADRRRQPAVLWSGGAAGPLLHRCAGPRAGVLFWAPWRDDSRSLSRADRHMKWMLPALVVAGCVGYLIYASGGSAEYYLTVSELRSQTGSGDVRVGAVVHDAVPTSDGGRHVALTGKAGAGSLPGRYA